MELKPLFRWAGGKKKMLKHYRPYLPTHFNTYVEPFLGAGAMCCWAYAQKPNARFILGDANVELMDVYRSIRDSYLDFKEKVISLSEVYLLCEKKQRKRFYYLVRQKNAVLPFGVEKSAALFFLLRTSFNGVWQVNKNTNGRFGTPAGLLNQKNMSDIFSEENLDMWSNFLNRSEVFCGDFEEITRVVEPRRDLFLFMDPPYRGCFTDYGSGFSDDDTHRLLGEYRRFKEQDAHVMLSNRDTGDAFFDAYNPIRFAVTYTAGRRKKTATGFEAKEAVEILLT